MKPFLVHIPAWDAGKDVDLIVAEEDIVSLIKLYPNCVKDLWGDLGICPYEFEIWRTICLFDYDYYRKDAIERNDEIIELINS